MWFKTPFKEEIEQTAFERARKQEIDALIAEHARAMQAARKRVDSAMQKLQAPVREPYIYRCEWVEDDNPRARDYRDQPGADDALARAAAEARPGVMIKADSTPLESLLASLPPAPPMPERVCTTCSKTCDVGVACWWCGNA